jgi:hypothetical protein
MTPTSDSSRKGEKDAETFRIQSKRDHTHQQEQNAHAAPVSGKAIAQMAGQSVQIIQVRDGCGRWRFRGRSGRCHPYTFRR